MIESPTLFSRKYFISAIVNADRGTNSVAAIEAARSSATVFGLRSIDKWGRASILLAPFGLYAYPSGSLPLEDAIPDLVSQLQSFTTLQFRWNVRFDHHCLATLLKRRGLTCFEASTHVLRFNNPYEEVFKDYSATTRNLVRQAAKRGVTIRFADSPADVSSFYRIYTGMIASRSDWEGRYSESLFQEVFRLGDDTKLLIAEISGLPVAGSWFLRDGNSLFYWQSAMDYAYRAYSPQYAIIDRAIRFAIDAGFATLNMGGSKSDPLRQFKEKWGAVQTPVWHFTWTNPIWRVVSWTRGQFCGRRVRSLP
jgi:predicted N-acyltransferase